ncbi:MAG: hypothetical protein QOH36_288 [Actinomycetota bacterium]|nr:hypothetical protein [Actinomycetota bacterium]
MRRILGVALGTTLVVMVGAGAVAWAGPSLNRFGGGDPATREAAKQCVADARAANPDADKAAIREAVKPCLEAAGIAPKELTAQQQARRDAAKACLQAAKEANPDADRPTIAAAAKPCLEAAGITARDGLERLRSCIDTVLGANSDGDRKALRTAVRECMANS